MKSKTSRRENTNVFQQLGFKRTEAENLRVRSRLMSELVDHTRALTQVQAAELLGVAQPRVSHLRGGKINLFTIDALVNMLTKAGLKVGVTVVGRRKTTAA